jgi:tetratricopeptide (TPR) repeat protein
MVANSAPPDDSLYGLIAGRFRIHERLGTGGMGEVYLAEDTRLKRMVAIKRLGVRLQADQVYRHRFQEEAERASAFTDPHIAAVYDVLDHQGELLLVMEFVSGQTLRERLRHPVAQEEFFSIATQCAEALIAAHDRGIVHCDIKPENIMLASNGQIKILDFGIAKYLPRSDQSSTVERSGMAGGTPAYMAPEVLLEEVPDARADIFSLGIVLYEMLTGNHPFLSHSFVATSERILHETPTPIRIFNREVPQRLEAVVNKALAKEAGQRYPDARALLDDLRMVQAGITPLALPSVRAAAPGWLSGGRLVALVLFLLAGLAGYGLYRWKTRAPILSERGWVLIGDFDARGDDPIPETGVREALSIALQQSRYINVFPRTRVYDVLKRMQRPDTARVDEALGREICLRENLQVLLVGSVDHVGSQYQITVRGLDPAHGNLYFAEKQRFSRKDDFFEKTDKIARQVRYDLGESLARIGENSPPLARVTTRSLEALQLYSQAKDASDHGKLDQVLAPLQGALRLDPDFAMAHLLLANYYGAIVSKNQQAIEEVTRAYQLRESVTDRERLWIEANYFALLERYEQAAQALQILVSLYPDDLDFHLALADAYDAVAQTDKTIAELREIVRINPQAVLPYSRLIIYLARSNKDEEAVKLYQEARDRGLDSPDLDRGLGLAYLSMGDVSGARLEFAKVQQSPQPFLDLGQFYLAKTDIYEGKLDDARRRLEAIVSRDQASHINGLLPPSLNLLGRIDLLLGQPAAARKRADEILAAPESDLLVFHVLSAGILYARAGAMPEAREVLGRLEKITDVSPTAWNKRSVLALQGEIALAAAEPAQARSLLSAAQETYPQAATFVPLALAGERQTDWTGVQRYWNSLLQNKGEVLQEEFPADLVLAHLHLARAARRLGDDSAARRHYQDFLQLWQQGDNIPQLRQAARELQLVDSRPADSRSRRVSAQ